MALHKHIYPTKLSKHAFKFNIKSIKTTIIRQQLSDKHQYSIISYITFDTNRIYERNKQYQYHNTVSIAKKLDDKYMQFTSFEYKCFHKSIAGNVL